MKAVLNALTTASSRTTKFYTVNMRVRFGTAYRSSPPRFSILAVRILIVVGWSLGWLIAPRFDATSPKRARICPLVSVIIVTMRSNLTTRWTATRLT